MVDSQLPGNGNNNNELTQWVMEPVGSMPQTPELFNNPYLLRTNTIPRID